MIRSPLRFSQTALSIAVALALVSSACAKRGSAAAGASHEDGGAGGATATVAAGLPAPTDVAAAPANAQKSATGLASKVLTPGTGTERPGVNDTVKVNYTGWTTDGKMFDSSVAPLQPGRKPEPASLSLGKVIPGWTEGLGQMVVGEKRRLWIPEALAYAGRPGAPQGMLVFDVELLEITPGPKAPMDVAAAPADAETSKTGLASKVLQKGTGTTHPQANDAVRVNASAWLRDGKLLDSGNDKPTIRPISGFCDGWEEALSQMVVGEKRTLWIPAALGPKARPGAPPVPDLTLVVELLEILPGPKTPVDVKAPPKDATVEKDGLASKVLTKGTGKAHPGPNAGVTIQYAAWTTDGKMFDSSYGRGEPATLAVNRVFPGWAEALQLMVEGEKRRVWIPADLANKGNPQGPQGTLVFDVELQKIGADMPAPGQQMGMPPGAGGPPGAMGAMRGGHPPMGGMPKPMPTQHP